MTNSRTLVSTKGYPNNFDFIRFVLASSVILCHSYAICYGYHKFLKKEPFMVLSNRQISIGTVAVDIFFIISGFLIVKSFENAENIFDYFKKRVLRIYPGFIVALVLSLMIVGFVGSGMPHTITGYKAYLSLLNFKGELVHLFTLQRPLKRDFFHGFPEPGVNDSVWTIQYEFGCYVLVPLLAMLGLLYKKKITPLLCFITVYILVLLQTKNIILPHNQHAYNLFFDNPYHYPRFIMYFLSGACFYFYRDRIIMSHWLALASLVAIYVSFALLNCADQVLPAAAAYLLFYIAFHPLIRLHNFAQHGDFSYGIYLYGWPVQMLIMFYSGQHIKPWLMFIIALPLAIAAAYCSWHLIEKPALQFKKRHIASA